MANPTKLMSKLDIQNYQKLPIDILLIQNYDQQANYLTMIDKSLQWK